VLIVSSWLTEASLSRLLVCCEVWADKFEVVVQVDASALAQ
jgi:hypothetical protein